MKQPGKLLGAHPAAEIFPLMNAAEFNGLLADIREHGLREPIVLHEGQILDGRNRYRACVELGIEHRSVNWDATGTPEAFVISHNLHRRHLNETQRAMIAARLSNAKSGDRNDLVENSTGSVSAAKAADMLNVNRASVFSAKRVIAEGTKEEIEQADAGEISVNTVAKKIREGQEAEHRAELRKTPPAQRGGHPDRIEAQRARAAIWGRLRDAISGLTDLPKAEDVARIAKSHDRAGLVEKKLSIALKWLQEFSDVYSDKT